MLLNKFSDFYKRFEKYISPIGLIYGFIFTSLTLTRVDTFLENFWIVVHLCLAASGIFTLTLFENRAQKKNLPDEDRQKFHFYLTLVIQFAFGGLFSTFFVFYMRSSSLAESWLFLLILVILLVGNELWKKHYSRLAFQISILFISIYLFLTFLFPVLFHRLGSDLFVAAGLASLVIVALFLSLLKKIAYERFKSDHHVLRIIVLAIFALMNLLYFTNIIPPIPLSLKASGVYHSISRNAAGDYVVTGEARIWRDYFNRYPVFHRKVGEPVYVFGAIFSPINFSTEAVHQWQYYDEVKKEWIDSSRIVMSIVGGREDGYRTYSFKQALPPGLWRVRITTIKDQTIGTVGFRVEEAVEPRPTYTQEVI